VNPNPRLNIPIPARLIVLPDKGLANNILPIQPIGDKLRHKFFEAPG
jgi:hypothetical protein